MRKLLQSSWLNVVIALYSRVREGVPEIPFELKVTELDRTIGERSKHRTWSV